ncbi:hypothetical protein CONLIGDRAFT_453742 [Coniochaeta ligniaria NRRL 30616]|uniref:Zn(2)-C6 fungal-type domain-containing protein n=1 Tax=Coniochaeta ligniaria NRRL 30616 TaxID=1408157 RepID=A0A1J7JF69_9PEZI|nr:hypothetical protein CONLIGDRAFT_453742 [Coniochaeta ligniaria NRRL 30616]
MLENPGHAAAASAAPVGADAQSNRKHHRSPRPRLSCEECRSRKLSCDRNLPCQRCVRSGKPERCSFTNGVRSRLSPFSPAPTSAPTRLNSDLYDQIRELRSEVAELRQRVNSNDSVARPLGLPLPDARQDPGTVDSGQTLLPEREPEYAQVRDLGASHTHIADTAQHDPKDPCSRSVQGYYRQHSLFRFFAEIPQLFGLIKETANEHFKPRNINLNKAKLTPTDALNLDVAQLAALLPPDRDAETLISTYLDEFERVHRVVHSTTYHPSQNENIVARLRGSQNNSKIALLLSMMTIAVTMGPPSPLRPGSDAFSRVATRYKQKVPDWIYACEKWLRLQNFKRRGLEYYQVSCLVYLAKRINGIKKKRFWNETGALIQEAVMDGLHRDPPSTDSPYTKEMKRRIWSTLRELDLQNSFEHGLPTLLHCLDSDVAAPANVEDGEFNEESETIPTKPMSPYQYTRASYQHLSARSWQLRLAISRLLNGDGSCKPPSEWDVLNASSKITEAMGALPFPLKPAGSDSSDWANLEGPFTWRTLTCQLNDCILALHRHRLQRGDANFSSFSEDVCYTTAKDILSSYKNVPEIQLRSLILLRADILTASLTLTRISLQQPLSQLLPSLIPGATNPELLKYSSALTLLEQCLPIIEERYIDCFNGEPWYPLTMLGAIMLLKIHLGTESRQTAKSSAAQRFLSLYYKHVAEQAAAIPDDDDGDAEMTPSESLVNFDFCDFDLDWDKVMGGEQPGALE